MLKTTRGFTQTILLMAIAILSLVVGVTIIIIDPVKKIAITNNSIREVDTNTLLKVINQYKKDNKGNLPLSMPKKGMKAVEINNVLGGADICSDFLPTYISEIPTDPSLAIPDISDCNADYATGYFVAVDDNGAVTISAPSAQAIDGSTPNISVTN